MHTPVDALGNPTIPEDERPPAPIIVPPLAPQLPQQQHDVERIRRLQHLEELQRNLQNNIIDREERTKSQHSDNTLLDNTEKNTGAGSSNYVENDMVASDLFQDLMDSSVVNTREEISSFNVHSSPSFGVDGGFGQSELLSQWASVRDGSDLHLSVGSGEASFGTRWVDDAVDNKLETEIVEIVEPEVFETEFVETHIETVIVETQIETENVETQIETENVETHVEAEVFEIEVVETGNESNIEEYIVKSDIAEQTKSFDSIKSGPEHETWGFMSQNVANPKDLFERINVEYAALQTSAKGKSPTKEIPTKLQSLEYFDNDLLSPQNASTSIEKGKQPIHSLPAPPQPISVPDLEEATDSDDFDEDGDFDGETDDEADNAPLLGIDINLEVELPNARPARNEALQANPNANAQLDLNINLAINNGGALNAEINANGDINAFLELLGIQGPLEAMFQNAFFVLLVMFAAIGVGVVVPWSLGRLTAVLLFGLVVPRAVIPLVASLDAGLEWLVDGIVVLLKVASNWVGVEELNITTLATMPMNVSLASTVVEEVAANVTNIGETVLKVQEEVTRVFGEDDKILLRDVINAVSYTFIGYLIAGFVLYYIAKRTGLLEHAYAYTFSRLLKSWTKYSYFTLKFTILIVVEIGLFPIFCGILIDFCTLPIFGPSATASSRYQFHVAHPWTSCFLHWVVGTTFMYQLAVYVSVLRDIFRPGVMWFVSDDKDGNFINDVMEKPILVHVRKFAVGSVMYATLILCGVGGIIAVILGGQTAFGVTKILPLKWELNESIAEFPIDLLLFHFMVPLTIQSADPETVFRILVTLWFEATARLLRITGFLFGGRHDDEESDNEDDEIEIWAGENPVEAKDGRRRRRGSRVGVDGAVEANVEIRDGFTADQQSGEPSGLTSSTTEQNSSATSSAHSESSTFSTKQTDPTSSAAQDEPTTSTTEQNEPTLITAAASRDKIRNKKYKASKREKRFLRVPNHDRIKIIPKVPVMIPMRSNEPVYGRPDEPAEDVRHNWTKVYVPPNLRARILIERSDPAAAHAIVEARSGVRPDLPVHDIYSWSVGMFTIIVFARPIIWLCRSVKGYIFPRQAVGVALERRMQLRRDRRNQEGGGNVRRRRNENRAGQRRGAANLDPVPDIQINIIPTIKRAAVVVYKAIVLAVWVGVVMPVLLGILLELCFVSPFKFPRDQSHIVFILQDWALGAVLAKIVHMLVLMGPENEVKRTFTQFNETFMRDFRLVDLKRLFVVVIAPTVMVTSIAIVGPLSLVYSIELAFGLTGREAILARRIVHPLTLCLGLMYGLLEVAGRTLRRWMEEVRDEHYLVGRQLHNLAGGATNGVSVEEVRLPGVEDAIEGE
ncbi:hypothetical protein HK096_007185, partial [Nowakowskiella sp. JEL0078]